MDYEAGNYEPPLSYVSDDVAKLVIENPQSPCTYMLQNVTRKEKTKPNMWSTMNTVRIRVAVNQIPADSEVLLISSYKPDFWMNQPKTQEIIITEAGEEHSFMSTNEVWIMTRCTNLDGCTGSFEIEYQRIKIEVPEESSPPYSLIITICIGFSLMFIAFLYFEWRLVYKCFKRCREKVCGRES